MRRKRKNAERAKKRKAVFAVVVEIIILTVKVLSCLLPTLWQLVLLMVIGARATILQAVRKCRTLPPDDVKKRKVVRAVIIELIFMTCDILCCLLPMPWRLVVPVVTGSRAIILQAYREYKKPPQRCTCGAALPQKTKAGKTK